MAASNASAVKRGQPQLVRTAVIIFLIGPLLLVVWYFGGSGPARPLPGSLWAQYESQVQATVRGAGGSIGDKGCEMMGNVSASLHCPVVGAAPSTLYDAFSAAGWKPASEGEDLVAEGARLSIYSASDGSSVKVSISLRMR